MQWDFITAPSRDAVVLGALPLWGGSKVRERKFMTPGSRVLKRRVRRGGVHTPNVLPGSELPSGTSNPHVCFPGGSWEFVSLSKSHPEHHNKAHIFGLNHLKESTLSS